MKHIRSLVCVLLCIVLTVSTGTVAFAQEEHSHNMQTVTDEDSTVEYTYCDSETQEYAQESLKNNDTYITLSKKLYPESKHNYQNYARENYAFEYPNAKKLYVTFSSQTYTESDYDFIYIHDMENNKIGQYSGSELAGKTVVIDGSSFRIRLSSDRSKTYYGFSIDKIDAIVNVNTYDYENAREDVSYSPIMPYTVHDYFDNTDESYTYTDVDASSLKVTFSARTRTEKDYDFITIYDYEGSEVGRYSGGELAGKTVKIEGPSFTVRLTSDRSKTYFGYAINEITSVKKDEEQDIRDYPASAHPYAPNTNETVSYSYPDEEVEALKVTFSSKCKTEEKYDVVTIIDGNGKKTGEYSGDELAGRTVLVNGNSFKINFKSDRSKQFYGYAVTQITPISDDTSVYPESLHPYSNYANESYHYDSRYEGTQSLKVKFSTDTYTEKDYDIISVYDANGELVGEYSGDELAGKTIAIDTPSFDIKFKSDRSKSYYGFSVVSIVEEGCELKASQMAAFPESKHNYEDYADQDYYYGSENPFVLGYKVKFSEKTMVENGSDFITISDDYTEKRYTGNELAGKTVEINSPVFKINLTSDRSQSYYGFSIDEITAVYDTDYLETNELEHNYQEVINRNQSVYRDGVYTMMCTHCGDSYSEYENSYSTIKDLDISLDEYNYIYNGRTHYPKVTVKTKHGTNLVEGEDYDIRYSGNGKEIGYYNVTIELKNGYVGKSVLQYDVKPRNISGFEVKPVLAGFNIYWTAQTNEVTGYEIQYSSFEDFRVYETINESQSYYYARGLRDLYREKTYFVRMRSYKRCSDSTVIYSDFTQSQSVTTGNCLSLNTRAAQISFDYDYVTQEVFGYSYQGRRLEAYIITPKNGYYNKTYVANFAIHGFEGESSRDGRYLVEEGNSVVEYYAHNPEKLKNMRLIVIPCLNPDGVISGTNELYTGSSSFGRNTANHVDLNRDFNTFRGQESRAMRSLLAKYNPDVFCDFHGWLDTTLGTPKMCDIFSDTLGFSRKQPNHYGASSGYMIGYVRETYGAASALVEYKNSNISHTQTVNAMNKAIAYYN